MTKKEALTYFRTYILPELNKQYSKDDVIARREAWSNYTDALCKSGQITTYQDQTWTNPF